MNARQFHFTLYWIIVHLTCLNPVAAFTPPLGENAIHFCRVIDWQPDQRHLAASPAADRDVGAPRTVRMIYFLPNDRPFRADVVQNMKDGIRGIQTLYAEQMGTSGYGKLSFRVETDDHGEPMVHRVDGPRPESHYLVNTFRKVMDEIEQVFNQFENIILVVVDNSTHYITSGTHKAAGFGGRSGKMGGIAMMANVISSNPNSVAAHELGHAFGLPHDFRNGAYIMSYGPGQERFSACNAALLAVHPYFNLDTPAQSGQPPSIQLVSPRKYPVNSESVPIQLNISDPDGLHAVFILTRTREPHYAAGFDEMKLCRRLAGEKDVVVDFDYDGVIPSDRSTNLFNPTVHTISVAAIGMEGNISTISEVLLSDHALALAKISGDNQIGFPNVPLPVPFVVELRDVNDGFTREGVRVTFTVTAAGGMLSAGAVFTDFRGRAQSTLTLGPNPGTNTVEATAEGFKTTFNAVAVVPVNIPDSNLRAVIEKLLDKQPGEPIATADMATLFFNERGSWSVGISNLTGLEFATNLVHLDLSDNSISDISPLAGLTKLEALWLSGNRISDLSSLVSNTGLGDGDVVDLRRNPLSYASIHEHIPILQARGVQINYDVNIPDSNLRAVIEKLLDKQPGEPIAPAGMATLFFNERGSWSVGISNLTGLEFATNLAHLDLSDNSISDISPLAGLTKLEALWLSGNRISDLSSLVSNTSLAHLDLSDNSISDISPLAGLTKLKALWLSGNRISDLSSLVSNTGLGDGDVVDLRRNPLSYASIHEHIPILQARGVQINYDVNIPDSNLRAVIEKLLDKQPGEPIATADMATLFFNERGSWSVGISNLTGLEFATNLAHLDLSDNSISDISPLAGLTKLEALWLSGNRISDLSSFVSNTSLAHLDLSDNSISDISPLAGLTKLKALWLSGNRISDLSSLVSNTGLGDGDVVDLRRNPLSYASIHEHIPTLQARGVQINYDDRTPTSLLIISGDNQKALPDTALPNPLVVEVQDQNGLAFEGVPITFALTEGSGLLNTQQTRTDFSGRAGTILTLGQFPEKNTVQVSAEAISRPVFFDAEGLRVPQTLLKLSGDDQEAPPGARLPIPFLVQVRDKYDKPVEGVQVVFAVTAGGGRLTATSQMTNSRGWARSLLRLGDNLGKNTVKVTISNNELWGTNVDLSVVFSTEGIMPTESALLANFPNPFTSGTYIPYQLSEDGTVTLTIHDTVGRLVRRLNLGNQSAGYYTDSRKAAYWDRRNQLGEMVASGSYYCQLEISSFRMSRRMVVLKR